MKSEPRVPPLPMEQWSDEVWDAVAVLGMRRPEPGAAPGQTSNALGIYAWNPSMVRGWMPFSNHLKHSSIPARIREMGIIRTTWLGRGECEWAQHLRIGKAAGLTDAEIEALSIGPSAPEWSEEDAVVLRAVDEMCQDRKVSDATWALLEKQFSKAQLIDFVFTIGTYDMHCMAFNTLELQLDAGLEGFPAETPQGAEQH